MKHHRIEQVYKHRGGFTDPRRIFRTICSLLLSSSTRMGGNGFKAFAGDFRCARSGKNIFYVNYSYAQFYGRFSLFFRAFDASCGHNSVSVLAGWLNCLERLKTFRHELFPFASIDESRGAFQVDKRSQCRCWLLFCKIFNDCELITAYPCPYPTISRFSAFSKCSRELNGTASVHCVSSAKINGANIYLFLDQIRAHLHLHDDLTHKAKIKKNVSARPKRLRYSSRNRISHKTARWFHPADLFRVWHIASLRSASL